MAYRDAWSFDSLLSGIGDAIAAQSGINYRGAVNAGAGVFGANGLEVAGASNDFFQLNAIPSLATIHFGMFFRRLNRTPAGTDYISILFTNTNGNLYQIRMFGDGSVQAYRGLGTNPLGTAAPAGSLPLNVYGHLYLKSTIHDSAGEVVLTWNGHTVISFPSVNTRLSGTDNFQTGFIMGGSANESDFQICHPWIDDTANLGRKRTIELDAIADGVQNDFTPSGAGDNYEEIDDTTLSTSDTSQVESATTNDTELYVMEQLPSTVTGIAALIPMMWGNVDDASLRTIEFLVRSAGGTLGASPSALDVASAIAQHRLPLLINPNTGVAFTAAELNAAGAQLGFRIAS